MTLDFIIENVAVSLRVLPKRSTDGATNSRHLLPQSHRLPCHQPLHHQESGHWTHKPHQSQPLPWSPQSSSTVFSSNFVRVSRNSSSSLRKCLVNFTECCSKMLILEPNCANRLSFETTLALTAGAGGKLLRTCCNSISGRPLLSRAVMI